MVKLADLGDLLTATPALRALRLRFPHAEITALVTPHTAPLLVGNDAVDRTIRFPKALFDRPRDLIDPGPWLHAARLLVELRRGRFDAVVLLHHLVTPWGRAKYRALLAATGAPLSVGLGGEEDTFLTLRAPDHGFGAYHEADYWLHVVNVLVARHPGSGRQEPQDELGAGAPEGQSAPPAPLHMELHLTESEVEEARAEWRGLGLRPEQTVVLHPGSGTFSVAKRWPPERYAAVAGALQREGLSTAVFAGPGEEQLAELVRAAAGDEVTLLSVTGSPRHAAALLTGCRLFVGNDSGIMHIAATVRVPVVAVFGLSNHRAWGPYPPPAHRVVRLDLPCSPCLYTGHSLGTPEGCPPRTCLNELGPERVIAAAHDLLAAAPAGVERSPR